MPRKTETAADGPRRVSSRIAAQPVKAATESKPAAPPAKKAAAKKEESTKRKAEDSAAAPASEVKKTKESATNGDAAVPAPAPAKSTSKKQLSVGDALPKDLSLKDETEAAITIADIKKAVIFMYPKANTGGCTKQGQCYRDEYPSWTKLGFTVYGLSNDNPTPLKNWKSKQNFPYKLLSDPERKFIGLLTGSKDKTIRSHVVVDGDGKIADIQLGVKPDQSSKGALKVAETIK